MELTEIHLLAEKRKWQNWFEKAYNRYELRRSDEIFGERVRFLVAKENGKELGFIRINNKTAFFKDKIEGAVWNAADAYVKPPYRGKGVLKKMIEEVIAKHEVKMCCLVPELFSAHSAYYKRLGFIKAVKGQDSGLIWLFHKDIAHLA